MLQDETPRRFLDFKHTPLSISCPYHVKTKFIKLNIYNTYVYVCIHIVLYVQKTKNASISYAYQYIYIYIRHIYKNIQNTSDNLHSSVQPTFPSRHVWFRRLNLPPSPLRSTNSLVPRPPARHRCLNMIPASVLMYQ